MNAETYNILLHLHSIGRWIVLLLLLFAIFNSLVAGNRPWIRTDARAGTILVIFADLMLLLGIVMWFFGPRGYKLIDAFGMSAVMKDPANRKPKALDLFNEAIRHDYNFLDAHIEKGITLYEQKKFKEAYQAFNLAMTISPKYADAYYWMGKSQQAMGDLKEARLNYQRAFGLDNTLVQAKQAADSIRN